jgi:hypothetical protein
MTPHQRVQIMERQLVEVVHRTDRQSTTMLCILESAGAKTAYQGSVVNTQRQTD